MDWRDEVANGFFVKPGVARPAEPNKRDFFIRGLLLLIALGGLAM